MPPGALSDVKVIDLTQYIAGPYCTKFLADYGAEVIKIEPPAGDGGRRLGPFLNDIPHPEKSGLFLHLNTNKKGLTLNLETATGQRILKQLVKDADILVEDFSPGVMADLGLSYDDLRKIKPDLVMVSLSAFGQTGPYRDYKANEMVTYAMGGVMSVTGMPDREPQKLGVTVISMLCGSVAAVAAMGALFSSKFQGEGQHVDVALMEVAAGSMDRGGPMLLSTAYSGHPGFERSRGSRTMVMPPPSHIPVADGYVCWQAAQPDWWPRFLGWLGREDLLTDPRFDQPAKLYNMENADYIDSIVLPHFFSHSKQEIMETAQGANLPGVTALNTPGDLFNDPQLAFRNFWVEVDHPVAGTFKYPGPQFRMHQTPWRAGRAPLLGEHNEEILCGRLGYGKQDLVLLRERGII